MATSCFSKPCATHKNLVLSAFSESCRQPIIARLLHSIEKETASTADWINDSQSGKITLSGFYAQRIRRSACPSTQSDQSSLDKQWITKDTRFLQVDSDDSAQTAHRLRGCAGWSVFAERTYPKVRFPIFRIFSAEAQEDQKRTVKPHIFLRSTLSYTASVLNKLAHFKYYVYRHKWSWKDFIDARGWSGRWFSHVQFADFLLSPLKSLTVVY